MNRALFVHTQVELLNRFQKESNGSALVTTSMVQALQWITQPDLLISGVFLSPDDSSFSVFRFLEIALTHRPALPIYLFEPSLHSHRDQSQKIIKNAHIRGVFSGSESYQALLSAISEKIPTPKPARDTAPKTVQRNGYIALPITDFFTGTHFHYDTFIMDTPTSMNLFAQKDSTIDPVYLSHAAQSYSFLYVREQDITQSTEALKNARTELLDSKIAPSWKTSEIMASARDVLNEMKSAGVNDQLIEYTQNMLGDLFKLISNIESDEGGSINGMIDKAKKCDRSVFCASYAILLCKQLKFEKTATLEILGLASVLQDISLYRTPFGDLSDKTPDDLSPEQMSFYLKHPILSADLIAQHTDVPQVTLQVVRQHHERKDMTGFPNRIGGSQLHPMAEILSLINAHYEVSKTIKDDALLIQELQKKTFPHYSENVVQAFKVVLGNILKDKIHAAAREQSTTN